MGDLSINFSRHEFQCHCGCDNNTVDYELLSILQILRGYYNRPITIASGFRCRFYNNAVGGANDSRHCLGKAADFSVEGISPGEVYAHIDFTLPRKYGLGLYDSWVHLDVRKDKARW